MTDPFKTKKSLKEAISTVKCYDFFTDVYPQSVVTALLEAIKTKSSIKPPKTIFVPSQIVLRKSMRAMLKYGKEDHKQILYRFGLSETH